MPANLLICRVLSYYEKDVASSCSWIFSQGKTFWFCNASQNHWILLSSEKTRVDSEGFEPPTSRVQGGRSTN